MKGRAVVIGTGVNELVAAHGLARAGLRVIVLEEHAGRDDIDSGWIPPRIVRELGLERCGLRIEAPDPWAAAPLPDGSRLELWRDMARSVEAIRRVSPHDAAKWPRFCERMARLARVLEALYGAPPPDPLGREAGALVRLASTAFRIRGLGRSGMEDFLRLLPMPVADWLDDWFENDALKGILGAAGVMHVSQGPRSGGTAFRLLHQHAGSPPGVFRPPRSNIRSVLSEIHGIEIRRRVDVARIGVRGEHVAGVVLADGEEMDTSLVVSGADPRRTLEGLVEPGWFDPEFLRAVGNIRARGVVARVNLTLDREPGFSTLVVAPSLDYLERAYDDAKYRRVSREPYVEARYVGVIAGGYHRIEAHVQYAPYALAAGEWDEARAASLERGVSAILARQIPALDAALVEQSVLTPRDLERAYGYPEGQAHHAELALDQAFWMRPLPGWANYRTPIGGLYLSGAATHPGAGVAGASGANAAREIIRDVKRGRLNHDIG